jgi:RNA polymerase sigma-70 factor (ECF subfamily)
MPIHIFFNILKVNSLFIILALYLEKMDDSQNIINNIKQGSTRSFEGLFREFYARLCEYSFLITRDKDASIEIVQDFFVKLWDNREKLEIKNIQSYLFRAVHNNSIKYLNKQLNFETIGENKEYGYELPEDFELAETIEKSLNELPPKCKEIFILSRIDKLKHSEIAEKMGITAKTVEVQIRKASLILKEKLKEFHILFIF